MENMDENGVPYRVNQHVFVDEQQETETILFKDDEYGHMQTVVFVDHKKVQASSPHCLPCINAVEVLSL